MASYKVPQLPGAFPANGNPPRVSDLRPAFDAGAAPGMVLRRFLRSAPGSTQSPVPRALRDLRGGVHDRTVRNRRGRRSGFPFEFGFHRFFFLLLGVLQNGAVFVDRIGREPTTAKLAAREEWRGVAKFVGHFPQA